MNHKAGAIDRLLQAGFVLQRTRPLIDRKSLKGSIGAPRAGPDQNPHLAASIEQTADDIIPDEASAAGYKTGALPDSGRGGGGGSHSDQTKFLCAGRAAAANADRHRTNAKMRQRVARCSTPSCNRKIDRRNFCQRRLKRGVSALTVILATQQNRLVSFDEAIVHRRVPTKKE